MLGLLQVLILYWLVRWYFHMTAFTGLENIVDTENLSGGAQLKNSNCFFNAVFFLALYFIGSAYSYHKGRYNGMGEALEDAIEKSCEGGKDGKTD